jgi:hypothetical protein
VPRYARTDGESNGEVLAGLTFKPDIKICKESSCMCLIRRPQICIKLIPNNTHGPKIQLNEPQKRTSAMRFDEHQALLLTGELLNCFASHP